jgi:hypothetical protein
MKQLIAVAVVLCITFVFSTPTVEAGTLRDIRKRIEKKVDKLTPDVVIVRLDTDRRCSNNFRRSSFNGRHHRRDRRSHHSGQIRILPNFRRSSSWGYQQNECPSGTRPRMGEGGRVQCIPWGTSAYMMD